METSICDKIIGDAALELARELSHKDRPDLANKLAIFAYGFYQRRWDTISMTTCYVYFDSPADEYIAAKLQVQFAPTREKICQNAEILGLQAIYEGCRRQMINVIVNHGDGYLFPDHTTE